MINSVIGLLSGSIAEEMGIEIGDKLLTINDKRVNDIIDYKFLMSEERLDVVIEKENGESWTLEIEKEYDEDIGLIFSSGIMDRARSCCNNCIFCFVDQLPKGLRKTMYFKDDDSRLSFLQGNFITLTNMSKEDIDRIIEYKISPINVSVHTTDPELRIKMIGNKNAGDIMYLLKKLTDNGIKINCQIVLCPGINNGDKLLQTVKDLYSFYPGVENVAAVPIGLTKFRDNLTLLTNYDKISAGEEIDMLTQVQKTYIKEIGTPFIRLSDEFYILADRDIPEIDFYADFAQVEDGIGMIRLLRENINEALINLSKTIKGSFTFVTGELAYSEIMNISSIIISWNKNIDINVYSITNDFFGKTITVAGLLTGGDIEAQLKDKDLGKFIILPKNMVKAEENIFLDDVSVDELSKKLNRKIILCDYTGEDLINILMNYSWEE